MQSVLFYYPQPIIPHSIKVTFLALAIDMVTTLHYNIATRYLAIQSSARKVVVAIDSVANAERNVGGLHP
jgi:hypothetical protein